MLSDPLTPTYNSVGLSLPRASGIYPGVRKRLAASVYRTPDGEFQIFTEYASLSAEMRRTTILMERRKLDTDTDPYNGGAFMLPNRFGLVYDVDINQRDTATDMPRLRTALLALVDSTFQGRLIGGEV
jgi:hypothetical protein